VLQDQFFLIMALRTAPKFDSYKLSATHFDNFTPDIFLHVMADSLRAIRVLQTDPRFKTEMPATSATFWAGVRMSGVRQGRVI
jgi:hypothetical protein